MRGFEVGNESMRWSRVFVPVAAYLGLLLLLWRQYPGMAAENDLMEFLQALSLAVGTAAAAAGLFLPNRRHPRFLFFALVVFLSALFLRELDIDRLGLPTFLVTLGSGAGRNLLIGGSVLAALVWFVRDLAALGPAVVDFLKGQPCRLLYGGVLFYLLSEVFDKHLLVSDRGIAMFLEELLENAATCLLMSGVLVMLAMRGTRQGRGKSQDEEA